MKVIVLFLALCLPVTAMAAHLVSDPEPCDYYVVSGLPSTFTAAQNVPGDINGKVGLNLDLSTLPAVTTNTQWTITAVCCQNTTITQTGGCSDASVPFVFTQTAKPPALTGAKIAP